MQQEGASNSFARCKGATKQKKGSEMSGRISSIGLGLVAASFIFGTVATQAYTGQGLANRAKIGIAEARAIALKAHPGKITDEELERESGGSGLRYSFDIKSGSVTQEVGVDARTGRVLENKKEGLHPD
jgi:hypothetical protein